MAIHTLTLDFEVEDTFQNGTALDVGALCDAIYAAADGEYERQVKANSISLKMKVSPRSPITDDTLDLTMLAPQIIEALPASIEAHIDLENDV